MIEVDTVANLSVFLSFGEGELLRSLAFSPNGMVLASAGGNSEDFDIRLWNVGDGQLLQTLQGHSSIIWQVAFSPDGRLLASASSDGTVKIWDWRSGSLLQSLDFPNQAVSVGFSPDSQTLAVGGVEEWPNAAIWTYSVASWQLTNKLAEFWNIPDLAYSPDGKLLVGGGTSRNVRIWRTSDGVEQTILYHPGQVSSVAISPDGTIVATGLCEDSDESLMCTHGAVWLRNLHSGSLIKKLSDFPDLVEGVEYSPDGSLVIAGSRDGTLRVYSTFDYQTVLELSSPGGGGILAVSPDGMLIATSGNNGLVHLWRVGP
jgi:WD40 repeat protein